MWLIVPAAPNVGFGLSVERTATWIAAIHFQREAIAYPRMQEKMYSRDNGAPLK